MAVRRLVRRIYYTAPILGGYPMAADIAPSEGPWRVIAIPGTPSRLSMFSRFLARTPADVEAVVPNRPGFGGPLYGRRRRAPVLSFDDQVAAFAPLFDKDDGKRTIALGCSYGGELALKCALDYPDRIEGVVTVAALIREPRLYIRALLPILGWPLVGRLFPNHLHVTRAEIAGRRPQIEAVLSRLQTYDKPVAILHGGADHLVPAGDADALRARFGPQADVTRVQLGLASHFLELERPDLCWSLVRDVLARADARRTQEASAGGAVAAASASRASDSARPSV